MILGDCFSQDVFKESLRRIFTRYPDYHPDAGHLQMGLAATLEVITSREFKISGIIGPCTGLGKKGPSVSEVTWQPHEFCSAPAFVCIYNLKLLLLLCTTTMPYSPLPTTI